MHTSTAGRQWRPMTFLYCYGMAGLLVISFLWQPTAMVWRHIDEAAFFLLNGSLDDNAVWAFFWAHFNTKKADIIIGLAMVLPLLWILIFHRRQELTQRLAAVAAIVIFTSLAVIVAKTGFNGYPRLSPSGELKPFVDLNQLVAGIKAKTYSGKSMPGDHAVTVFVYAAMMITLFKSRVLVCLVLCVALLSSLPRLFAGAHWLSDIAVGSGALALVIIPLALGSPSLRYMEAILNPVLKYILKPLLVRFGRPEPRS